jgi:hypothetical protein
MEPPSSTGPLKLDMEGGGAALLYAGWPDRLVGGLTGWDVGEIYRWSR